MNLKKLFKEDSALLVVLVLWGGLAYYFVDGPSMGVILSPVALGMLIFAIWLTGGFEKKKGYGRGGGSGLGDGEGGHGKGGGPDGGGG